MVACYSPRDQHALLTLIDKGTKMSNLILVRFLIKDTCSSSQYGVSNPFHSHFDQHDYIDDNG